MLDIGVVLSMKNEEYLVQTTYNCLRKVFPPERIIAFDVGSQDATVEKLQELGVDVRTFGEVNGTEYTELKDTLARSFKWCFSVDGDDIYPEASIRRVISLCSSTSADMVRGHWRNLKGTEGKKYVSSLVNRGGVCWNTDKVKLVRSWPNERAGHRTDSIALTGDEVITDEAVFCYHGLLLERSSTAERGQRHKKRIHRMQEFKDLDVSWHLLEKLPEELVSIPDECWRRSTK